MNQIQFYHPPTTTQQEEVRLIQKQSDPNRPLLSLHPSQEKAERSRPSSVSSLSSTESGRKKLGKKEIVSQYERYIEELKEHHDQEVRGVRSSLMESNATLSLLKETNIQLKTRMTALTSNRALHEDNERQHAERLSKLQQQLSDQKKTMTQQQSELSTYKGRTEALQTTLKEQRQLVTSLQADVKLKSETLTTTQSQLLRLQKEFTEQHRQAIDKYDQKMEKSNTAHQSEVLALKSSIKHEQNAVKRLEEENQNLKVVMKQNLTCSQVDKDVIQSRLTELQDTYQFKLDEAENKYKALAKGSYQLVEKLKGQVRELEGVIESERNCRTDSDTKLEGIEESHVRQVNHLRESAKVARERQELEMRRLKSQHDEEIQKYERQFKVLRSSMADYDALRKKSREVSEKLQSVTSQCETHKARIITTNKSLSEAEKTERRLLAEHKQQDNSIKSLQKALREWKDKAGFQQAQLEQLHLDYNKSQEDNKVIPALREQIRTSCTELQMKKKELYETSLKEDSKRKEMDALRESNGELMAQNNYLKKKVGTIPSIEESITTLTQELESTKLILTRKDEVIHQLGLAKDAIEQGAKDNTKQVLTLTAENKTLRFKISTLEDDRRTHLKQLTTSAEQLKQLQVQLSTAKEQAKLSTLDITNYADQLRTHKADKEADRKTISDLKNRLNNSETHLHSVRASVRAERDRYDALKKKHDEEQDNAKISLKDAKDNINFLTRSNYQLKQFLDELTDKYNREKDDFERRGAELKEARILLTEEKETTTAVRRQNTKLTVRVTQLEHSNRSAEERLNRAKVEVRGINAKLQSLTKEVSSLQVIKQTAQKLKASLTTAQEQVVHMEQLQRQYGLVCKEKEALVGECGRLQSEVQSNSRIIAKNKELLDTMEHGYNEVRSSNTKQNQQISSYHNTITDLQKQLVSVQADSKSKVERNEILSAKYSQLEVTNQKLNDKVAQLVRLRNELVEATSTHQHTIDDLTATLTEFRTKNEQLKETILKLETDLKCHTDQEDAVRERDTVIRGLKDQLQEQTELTRKNADLEDLVQRDRLNFTQTTTQLTEKLKSSRATLTEHKKTLEQQDTTITTLREKLDTLTTTHGETHKQYVELRLKWDNLKKRYEVDQDTIKSLTKSAEDRHQVATTLRGDIVLLKETITGLTNMNNDLKAELEDARSRVQHYVELDIPENQIKALRQTISDMSKKHNELKATCTLLQQKLTESERKTGRIGVLEREITEHQNQYALLKKSHTEVQHRLGLLPTREQLSTFTGKIEVLTSENNGLKKRVEHYNEQALKVTELGRENHALTRERDSLKESITELHSRFNQVLDDIGTMKKQHRQEVTVLEQKYQIGRDYQGEIETLQTKLKEARVTLIPTLKGRISKLKKDTLELMKKHDAELQGYKNQIANVKSVQNELDSERVLSRNYSKTIEELKLKSDTLQASLTELTSELKSVRGEAQIEQKALQAEIDNLRKTGRDTAERLEQISSYCEKNHAPLESKLSERQLRIKELEKLLVTAVTKS